MFRVSTILLLLLSGAIGFASSLRSQDLSPDDLWVSAYGWLQTGTRLAEAEQWPLALGSFIESHRQVEILSEKHAEFEPEIIAYRRGILEEQIKVAQENLKPGEQEIMRKYLDFIDSYEEGLRLRFANEFVKSLNTLDIAKVLLDEIIFEKPDEFREAVDSQYRLLHASIEWLDAQINFKQRSRPSVFVADGVEWGTTEFVGEGDLPGEGGGILMEGALFPGGVVQRVRLASEPEVDEVGESPSTVKPDEKDAAGLPGFRMSSKQDEIPNLPEKLEDKEAEDQ